MTTPIISNICDFWSKPGTTAYLDARDYPWHIVERFLSETKPICYAYLDKGGEILAKYKGEEAYAFESTFKERMESLMDERKSKIKVWSLTAAFVAIGYLLR